MQYKVYYKRHRPLLFIVRSTLRQIIWMVVRVKVQFGCMYNLRLTIPQNVSSIQIPMASGDWARCFCADLCLAWTLYLTRRIRGASPLPLCCYYTVTPCQMTDCSIVLGLRIKMRVDNINSISIEPFVWLLVYIEIIIV